MTLREYLTTLRRYWVGIAVLTVLGGVVAYGAASAAETEYQSSTSVLLTSELGGTGSDLVQGSTYVQNLVASYVLLATSEKVLQPVIDDLGLDTTPRALAGSVSADSPINTVLINIHVVGPNPSQVATIADAVTKSLSKAVSDVSPTIAGSGPAIRLSTMQSATVPSVPVAPNKRRWVAIGMAVGLLAGVGSALLRRTFGAAINDAADVARVTEVPVVGEIVEARRGTTLPAAVLENGLGLQAESLRGLTANLNFLGIGGGLRSLVVTSASPAESKSSIATSMAVVLAEASHRVLLVDADLRAPTLHLLTNLDNTIGLSTVLIGKDSVELAAQQWGHEGLHVLTSGPLAPNPSQLLNSDAMRKLLENAWHSYDYVIVDSAPLLSVTDAVWLGHMVDSVLLIARRGKTKPRSLHKALDALAASHTTVAGVVISRVTRRSKPGYGYTVAEQRSRPWSRKPRAKSVSSS